MGKFEPSPVSGAWGGVLWPQSDGWRLSMTRTYMVLILALSLWALYSMPRLKPGIGKLRSDCTPNPPKPGRFPLGYLKVCDMSQLKWRLACGVWGIQINDPTSNTWPKSAHSPCRSHTCKGEETDTKGKGWGGEGDPGFSWLGKRETFHRKCHQPNGP